MSLHAFEAIDDALEATKSLLLPFDRGVWFRLALVVIFAGATVNLPTSGFNYQTDTEGGVTTPQVSDVFAEISETVLLVVAVAVVVGLLFLLSLIFVASVMEFVFVESLRSETVRIRHYWRRHWRRGVRLFGFRLAVGVLALLVLGAVFVGVFLPALQAGEPVADGHLVWVTLILVLTFIVAGLVNGFTTAFVVPVMLLEDRGVIDGWRRLWPTIRSEWKEYLVYVVLSWVFAAALGILVMIAAVVGSVLLAIPFVIVGLLAFLLPTMAGLALIALLVLVYVTVVVLGAMLLQVPVKSYLRYYALFILGDTEPELDPIADMRAAVRSQDGGDGDGGGGEPPDAGDDWAHRGSEGGAGWE